MSLAPLFLVFMSGNAAALTCEEVLKTHGFLKRAQFQCDFRFVNDEMMQVAASCGREFGKAKSQEIMARGFRVFDQNDTAKGRSKICREVLDSFPKILKE